MKIQQSFKVFFEELKKEGWSKSLIDGWHHSKLTRRRLIKEKTQLIKGTNGFENTRIGVELIELVLQLTKG